MSIVVYVKGIDICGVVICELNIKTVHAMAGNMTDSANYEFTKLQAESNCGSPISSP
jgi:hypothetical protein